MISHVVLLTGGEQNAANRLDRTALTTDDAAHVKFTDANLEAEVSAVGDLIHLDRISIADKGFHNCFDSFFHFMPEAFPTQLFSRLGLFVVSGGFGRRFCVASLGRTTTSLSDYYRCLREFRAFIRRRL